MKTKTIVMIAMIVGSTVGGWIPSLWGVDSFSMTSLAFGTLGGIAGIVLGVRLARRF